MAYGFLDIATTRSVRDAQAANGSAGLYDKVGGSRRFDRLTEAEAEFIGARDSFYLASVSETGWPYVQHRGGPAGFLMVVDAKTLAFAEFRGNRQYITLGNTNADNRVALILMDYPNRRRLKIYARIEVRERSDDPETAAAMAVPGYRAVVERVFFLHLEAFDWNCPQHITPRFTEAEVTAATAPLTTRLAELEAENAALREALANRETRT